MTTNDLTNAAANATLALHQNSSRLGEIVATLLSEVATRETRIKELEAVIAKSQIPTELRPKPKGK